MASEEGRVHAIMCEERARREPLLLMLAVPAGPASILQVEIKMLNLHRSH